MSPQLKADLNRYAGDEFVDVNGAAVILNVSASFLNKARLTGAGPRFNKFGKVVRYRVEGLLDWATAQGRMSTSERREVA